MSIGTSIIDAHLIFYSRFGIRFIFYMKKKLDKKDFFAFFFY